MKSENQHTKKHFSVAIQCQLMLLLPKKLYNFEREYENMEKLKAGMPNLYF